MGPMPGRGSTHLVLPSRYEGTSLKLRGWGLDTRTSRSPGVHRTNLWLLGLVTSHFVRVLFCTTFCFYGFCHHGGSFCFILNITANDSEFRKGRDSSILHREGALEGGGSRSH